MTVYTSCALFKHHLGNAVAQVQLAAALLDVIEDRAGEPAVWRPLEQVELGGFGFGSKHHEDGEHAASRDRFTVDEAQGIGDRIPHPLDALLAAAMAEEPLLKADAIKVANHLHRPLVIHQTAHNRAGAQRQGIAQLVEPVELGGGEKGLQAVEGCAEGEAEIQLAQVAAGIHEQVGVVFREQVVDRTHFAQQGKEVGVVEKEHMQPHLDVIAALIDPAAHLAAHKWPGFVEIHLMAGIHQIHGRGQTSQT